MHARASPAIDDRCRRYPEPPWPRISLLFYLLSSTLSLETTVRCPDRCRRRLEFADVAWSHVKPRRFVASEDTPPQQQQSCPSLAVRLCGWPTPSTRCSFDRARRLANQPFAPPTLCVPPRSNSSSGWPFRPIEALDSNQARPTSISTINKLELLFDLVMVNLV